MLRNPKYVYGPCDVDVPMRINFGEFILNRFLQFKDEVAIIDEATSSSVTYRQIAQEAATLAVSLTRLGVRQGDVVAICSEKRMQVWSAVVGIACAGAVMTPLNMEYTQGELTHTLNISKPKYIIASPDCYKTHGNIFRTQELVKKIIIFGDEIFQNTVAYNDLVRNNVKIDDLVVPDVKGQVDTLFILYSSGTTGLPKGVMLTHLNLITTFLLPSFQKPEEHRSPAWISVTPWFHAMGLIGFLVNLAIGNKIVILPRFDIEMYMRTIEKYKVTHLSVVPAMLVALAKSNVPYDVSSVKYFVCGAAPLPANILPTVKARFHGVIGILNSYGMTEMIGVAKDSIDEKTGLTIVKPNRVGRVLSGCVVKIADLETRNPLGPLQQGEVCIKSVTLMKGYIGKDLKEDLDDEGFFKTGDVGYCDEEGILYIVDRLKELIKYKGYQVAPAEIEAVLLQHEGVRDAGVVGVPHGEGEAPRAFVVPQPGSVVTEEGLKLFVAERLSNPKHLRGGVRFVSEIPKNLTGKILRRQLRLLVDKEKSKL